MHRHRRRRRQLSELGNLEVSVARTAADLDDPLGFREDLPEPPEALLPTRTDTGERRTANGKRWAGVAWAAMAFGVGPLVSMSADDVVTSMSPMLAAALQPDADRESLRARPGNRRARSQEALD